MRRYTSYVSAVYAARLPVAEIPLAAASSQTGLRFLPVRIAAMYQNRRTAGRRLRHTVSVPVSVPGTPTGIAARICAWFLRLRADRASSVTVGL